MMPFNLKFKNFIYMIFVSFMYFLGNFERDINQGLFINAIFLIIKPVFLEELPHTDVYSKLQLPVWRQCYLHSGELGYRFLYLGTVFYERGPP